MMHYDTLKVQESQITLMWPHEYSYMYCDLVIVDFAILVQL